MSSNTPRARARALDPSTQNALAQHLASLHRPPHAPLVLANVYSAGTAAAVSSHPHSRAVATASYAIAAEHYGVADDDMTLTQNLDVVGLVAPVVLASGKPLTVDLQDGYEDVGESVGAVICLGGVGCNLEDSNCKAVGSKLRDADDAVSRIQVARRAATDLGVPDFVINARTDAVVRGGTVEEAIERGQKYLGAGATNVFVWGGRNTAKGGLSRDEVVELVRGLHGRLNVIMRLDPGYLGVKELKELGVARISVGPGLFLRAMKGFEGGLDEVLGSGQGDTGE